MKRLALIAPSIFLNRRLRAQSGLGWNPDDLLCFFLAVFADAIKIHAVVGNLVAVLVGDFFLLLFNDLVEKLFHLATAVADDMVVVVIRHQLKD